MPKLYDYVIERSELLGWGTRTPGGVAWNNAIIVEQGKIAARNWVHVAGNRLAFRSDVRCNGLEPGRYVFRFRFIGRPAPGVRLAGSLQRRSWCSVVPLDAPGLDSKALRA